MTKTILGIYPLFKFSNKNDTKKRVEARDASRGRVRDILGLSANMNKMVRPTNLSNDKDPLIVEYDDIEGGLGPPLDSNYL